MGRIIAATGHRPADLGGYSQEVDDKLFATALQAIDLLEPSGIISGMAIGWDMAIAMAALKRNIPLTAAIPFYGQESRWPKASQDRYKYILDNASSFICVSPGGYASEKMHVRNSWMVDNCDDICALYNGKRGGGTYSCIRYALNKEKIVYNVWEIFTGKQSMLTRIKTI